MNKLFLNIQDMNQELDQKINQIDVEKNSFIDMLKLDKTSIIAKWGKAGWMAVSFGGGAIGAIITYLVGL